MASVQLKSLDDGNKTDVPESGVTVVGRGPFLEITDKRVSRNHANLEILDSKLYLTPIHVNPCFFKKGGEGSQKILEKDEKFCLEEGDVFGLLPDQLFFKVLYKNKTVNGDVKKEPESVPSQTNGDTKSERKADPDESWDKSSDNEKEKEKKKIEVKVKAKPDVKNDVKAENNIDKGPSSSDAGPSTVTPPGQKEMALPLERKRQLPAWLIQAAETSPSPEKKKPAPKVPAASKRAPRAATSKPIPEAFLTDGEDDEVIPVKKSRGRPAPRRPPPKDSFSEAESEEEPPPKPQNKSKTLTPGTRTPRRKDQYNSDDEGSDEPVGRKAKPIPRRTARPPTPESFTPTRRPVRAAKYARGSYEDDVSDEYDEFGSQKKYEEDSDFIMDDDDSGSDWGSKKSKGKGKGKVVAKNTPKPRSTARGSRSRGRSRKSRSDEDSDEYLDEYIPRPSKRRASKAAKSESEEESSPPPKSRGTKKKKKPDSEDDDDGDDRDDGDDEPKKRKPCEFGKKCYRKNPAHFKECCHPGDKSYDEEEEDENDDKPECPYGSSCFRTNAAHVEQYSHNNKPKKEASKPKQDNAGKKSVLEGDEDDDGERNTYDYNDSFLDNNEADESEESFLDPAEEDSDYDPESEDVTGLVKEAKSFQKNKKLVKPARSR